MPERSDWLPGPRREALELALNWCSYLTPKAAGFNIPAQAVTDLAQLASAANTALATAMDETTRTPVANAACRAAFTALVDAMRSFKKHYILMPPMSEADFTALGLRVPDSRPSPAAAPTAQVRAAPFLVGAHQMGVRYEYVTGDPGDKANKGRRVYYLVVAPGGAAPADPSRFTESFYTQRRSDVIDFPFGSSGSTVYFCVQAEHGSKKGPWGPIASAIIP